MISRGTLERAALLSEVHRARAHGATDRDVLRPILETAPDFEESENLIVGFGRGFAFDSEGNIGVIWDSIAGTVSTETGGEPVREEPPVA